MSEAELFRCVGAVRDPHLPFGLAELGMLERVSMSRAGDVAVVVNVPCHHCPGLQMMNDDIHDALRGAGVCGDISVSFQGRQAWTPAGIEPQALAAMRTMGIQVVASESDSKGVPT